MGGFGSGRVAEVRFDTEEDLPRIDLRTMLRGLGSADPDLEGITLVDVPDGFGSARWWVDLNAGRLTISAEVDDLSSDATMEIDADSMPQGGSRWRAGCPHDECQSRARAEIIHLSPKIGWACRRCAGVRYRSTRLRPAKRAAHRARKLREPMEGLPRALLCEPERPYGMAPAEYQRRVRVLTDAAERWYNGQQLRIAQLYLWAIDLLDDELTRSDRKALEVAAQRATRRGRHGAAVRRPARRGRAAVGGDGARGSQAGDR